MLMMSAIVTSMIMSTYVSMIMMTMMMTMAIMTMLLLLLPLVQVHFVPWMGQGSGVWSLGSRSTPRNACFTQHK